MKNQAIASIEKITNGESLINSDQLESLDNLENVYIENCGWSGTNQGIFYVIYLTDADGRKTETELAEIVLEK